MNKYVRKILKIIDGYNDVIRKTNENEIKNTVLSSGDEQKNLTPL